MPERWPLWERLVRWRHRRTPYCDVARLSPYRRRYEASLPRLREASHYPVIRAQTRHPDRLESRAWYFLRLPGEIVRYLLVGGLGRPLVRDVVYCVDCGAEARAHGLPRRLVGPLSDHPCPGRPDGSEPLSARAVAAD